MKVVEKDNLVHEMLREELDRCRNMSASLVKMLAGLPKVSLHVRCKEYKGKKYAYQYLKYREGSKNYSKHVSAGELDKLSKKLDLRKKYMSELSSYSARIKYLEKILSVKK
ncbi:MAG: hypothetical protein NT022_02235 [Deltaproteobacteria bacterium]|nr:hypothetical protein [Deltaproteobacteria bacterium]